MEHLSWVTSANGYEDGCRCDDCKGVHRRRIRARQEARCAGRVEIDGRMVAVDAPRHGTSSTYRNWGCQCGPCTDANTNAHKAWRERRRRAQAG